MQCILQLSSLPSKAEQGTLITQGSSGQIFTGDLKKKWKFLSREGIWESPKPSCINFAVDEGVKLACVYQQGSDPFKSFASSPLVKFVVPVGRGWL